MIQTHWVKVDPYPVKAPSISSKVLEALEKAPYSTAAEIGLRMELSEPDVMSRIKDLIRQGKVDFEMRRSNMRNRIVKKFYAVSGS